MSPHFNAALMITSHDLDQLNTDLRRICRRYKSRSEAARALHLSRHTVETYYRDGVRLGSSIKTYNRLYLAIQRYKHQDNITP